MKKIRKILVSALSLALIANLTACKQKPEDSLSSSEIFTEPPAETQPVTTEPPFTEPDISGQTIYWLSDYNLNPEEGEKRSTALALFEHVYGANIEYIHADRA